MFSYKYGVQNQTKKERRDRRVAEINGGRTHWVRHVVGERLVLGHQAVGHVGRVRQLGTVHEVIHRRTTGGDVREVKVPVPLVTVAWRKTPQKTVNTCTFLTVVASQWLPVRVLPWLPYSLLLPPCWDSKGYGEGPGPSWAIISITLGMIIWLGLIVLNLLASGPSGSSLMWMSDFIATGRQLHVGSMVTSSNSELLE